MSRRWLDDDRRALAADRILDAAAALFAERGVVHTDMADIAAAAGCSRATLYRYFENRRVLQIAFVHRETIRIAGHAAEQAAGIGDPVQRLVRTVTSCVRAVRADPTLAAWFRPEDMGLATELATSSELIEAVASTFFGSAADDDARERARWLVRTILSLLTVPGADEADESRMVERFVAPVLVAPVTSPAAR